MEKKVMIRYVALLVLVVFGTVTGVSAIQPADEPGKNLTVIYKTDEFPVFEPLRFERCVVEDCSDTEA
jgi:hypothetical protein